jgi:acetyltransferase-like isoleucine patch superfamily enzyme
MSDRILKTIRVYKNVKLKKGYRLEDFVIIGRPPDGKEDGESETVLGANAVIRSHTVIYSGNVIGNEFKTGHHVMIRENNIIGNNVSIGTHTVLEHDVKIGSNVRVHSNVFIPEYSILEDSCWIGPNVVFTNALYPLSKGVKENLKGPVIKKRAIIGANSTILPGIIIGENSLIGAGSVVTRDVDNNVVVAGNPAKIINDITNLPY